MIGCVESLDDADLVFAFDYFCLIYRNLHRGDKEATIDDELRDNLDNRVYSLVDWCRYIRRMEVVCGQTKHM